MRLVPEGKREKISFFQSKLAPWLEHAGELGISVEAVEELEALVAEAKQAALAQAQAQSAAQAATAWFDSVVARMAKAGANIISQVRVTAATSGQGVYSLASIPAPAAGSPVAPPGRPTSLKFKLLSIGWLDLTWKCRNPRGSDGTTYQIYRKVDSAAGFEYLGGSGEKRFIDSTIPAGARTITYQIQACRSTGPGESAFFPINFGSTGSNPVMQSYVNKQFKAIPRAA